MNENRSSNFPPVTLSQESKVRLNAHLIVALYDCERESSIVTLSGKCHTRTYICMNSVGE